MNSDDLFAKDDVKEEIAVVQEIGWDAEVKKTAALIATAQQIPDAEMVTESKRLAAQVLSEANSLTVTDAESYKRGCDLSVACQTAIKAAKANPKLNEGWEAAKTLHKWFTDLIASLTKPYADARKIVDEKTGRWHRAEQARVDAENRERQRLADEAARRKREEQAKIVEEEARVAREEQEAAAKATSDDADRKRIEEAAARANVAAEARAQAMREQPVLAAPVEKVEVTKVEGVSHRENWKADGEDLMVTIKAVAAGEAPVTVLTWDQKELTRMAKALKSTLRIPGVRVYDAGTTAVR